MCRSRPPCSKTLSPKGAFLVPNFSDDVLPKLAVYAFVLNAAWEYAQLLPLYTCWEEWQPWQRALLPLACTVGDVVIVLGVAGLTEILLGAAHLTPPSVVGIASLLGLGFTAGVLLEWMALELGLWAYKPAMPTLRIGSWRIGFLPVLQITVLPALSVFLATL